MRLTNDQKKIFILTVLVFILAISLTMQYSYLLFHVISEFFSIIIAGVIFVIAWNSRDKLDNGFFLVIGISFFFIGTFDLVHTLAYKGMGIFTGYDANLPTQLWIAARYMEAMSFLIAPFFIVRRVHAGGFFWGYFIITTSLFILIFRRYFPDCYIEGSGLTSFKIISEYIICLILALAIFLLYKNKHAFSKDVLILLYGALIATIGSELAFTSYISVYGPANFLGHILKIVAFALIYQAIVVTGIRKPFEMIFRNLSESEKKYRGLFENMDEGIAVFSLIFQDNKAVDYLFSDLNLQYAQMMGTDPDQLIGKTGKEIYNTAPPPHIQQFEKIARDGISERFIVFYKPELKYYAISAFSMGKNTIATVVADITAMKVSEGALIRANQKLQLLSQITRHDINNDLSLAYASIDLIKNRLPEEPEVDQYFSYLRESIDAINSKISFTRNYEQMGTQKPTWHLVRKVVDDVHVSNPRFSNIKLNNNLGDLKIFADMMLQKVFANLMDNSVRHGETVTSISLSYEVSETGCHIYYEDNGVGISPKSRVSLFEPGYGATHGFGLFLIKEILLLTGIGIYEDGKDGKGVRFVLQIPKGGYVDPGSMNNG
ncbi:MASE3 domain-containing protein [Methanospirillum sp.]